MKNVSSNTNLKIELRYSFDDENKHSINAEIFNECEKQFIKAIKSTEKYFDDTIEIKINPREEGSLIDILTVVVNNPEIRTNFTTLLIIFATKFFNSKFSSAKQEKDVIKIESTTKANLIIANINGRNANVMYELGIAQAMDKPVLLVSKDPESLPVDIKSKRFLIYSDYENLKNLIRNELINIS